MTDPLPPHLAGAIHAAAGGAREVPKDERDRAGWLKGYDAAVEAIQAHNLAMRGSINLARGKALHQAFMEEEQARSMRRATIGSAGFTIGLFGLWMSTLLDWSAWRLSVLAILAAVVTIAGLAMCWKAVGRAVDLEETLRADEDE